MTRETKNRSLAKGISWRLIASLTTFIIAVVVFHEDEYVWHKASAVAGLEIVIKLIIYYLHERVWQNLNWGVNIDSKVKDFVNPE